MAHALVFGGGGQIGAACGEALARLGFSVLGTGRRADPVAGIHAYDPLSDAAEIPGDDPFEAVVWAQGANLNDSVIDFDVERHRALYEANVLYVAASMNALLTSGRVRDGARMVVISSVWQRIARRNKFSYMVTKAALQGLVQSAALDLAEQGIMVNAVLPGALDTPMTRANLTVEQIDRLAGMTPFNRLPAIADVANLTAFLCSEQNSSITGQFVSVDLGFENAKLV
ncbi:SDR family NAD(P)-dependent oxidoreductase [Sphingomonas sp. GCM10030256]|uniref:SDR family NAD(P)-dependent oxidoreductase n=1 Tax=Sphingomonas sp. GCM10030256 TaxID=3273427 RepID=UPI0036103ABF